MVMWDHGGFYLDAKLLLAQPISTWVDQERDDFALCNDGWQCGDRQVLFNAVLASKPRRESTLAVVRHIVSNIQRRFYGGMCEGHEDLEITGPAALTFALSCANFTPSVRCELFRTDPGKDTIAGRGIDVEIVNIPEKDTILLGSDAEVHSKMRNCANCNSYGSLFDDHAIYFDERYDGTEADPCRSSGKTEEADNDSKADTSGERDLSLGEVHIDPMHAALSLGGWSTGEHYWSKVV